MCADVTKNKAVWFDELSMPEAEQAAKDGKVVIIPVGSIEEHGTHLPLNTDSLQAEFVALGVAEKTGCLVAPPLRYGLCSSTRNFPGTITISFDSLRSIMTDIFDDFVRGGFKRLLVITGHAGGSHTTAIRLAAKEVVTKHMNQQNRPRIMVCSDYDFAFDLKGIEFDERDSHAGTIETSRVMAIRPDLIKCKGEPNFPNLPRFEVTHDPEKYFPSGVMGDPTVAVAEKGHKINDYVIEQICKLVKELEQ
ncbi:MAG: creatininase family protein [Candidatus Bathyarchaeota archaeon]|nr:creatininase family protein [Candidatus Bathyarchaeota archaeon]